eukprot:CAMPEP_0194448908 /NCGR_PEP_ID=MMETSP0176-20130528/129839_1 /TAXON_ID=216777 /ORGANISM="Proboscia alata, Strain PI-D3" /LENGTH=641 /DNA_ID=CAMNT_0039275957 /DNA_START=197 /DNA_END=2119 /DNA_ORIENTATION=-
MTTSISTTPSTSSNKKKKSVVFDLTSTTYQILKPLASATLSTTQKVLSPATHLTTSVLIPELIAALREYWEVMTPQRVQNWCLILLSSLSHFKEVIDPKISLPLVESMQDIHYTSMKILSNLSTQQFFIDSTSSLIRLLEVCNTPESHDLLDQTQITIHRFIDILSCDDSKELLNQVFEGLWNAVELMNDPTFVLSVVDVLSHLCHALEQERLLLKNDKSSISDYGSLKQKSKRRKARRRRMKAKVIARMHIYRNVLSDHGISKNSKKRRKGVLPHGDDTTTASSHSSYYTNNSIARSNSNNDHTVLNTEYTREEVILSSIAGGRGSIIPSTDNEDGIKDGSFSAEQKNSTVSTLPTTILNSMNNGDTHNCDVSFVSSIGANSSIGIVSPIKEEAGESNISGRRNQTHKQTNSNEHVAKENMSITTTNTNNNSNENSKFSSDNSIDLYRIKRAINQRKRILKQRQRHTGSNFMSASVSNDHDDYNNKNQQQRSDHETDLEDLCSVVESCTFDTTTTTANSVGHTLPKKQHKQHNQKKKILNKDPETVTLQYNNDEDNLNSSPESRTARSNIDDRTSSSNSHVKNIADLFHTTLTNRILRDRHSTSNTNNIILNKNKTEHQQEQQRQIFTSRGNLNKNGRNW